MRGPTTPSAAGTRPVICSGPFDRSISQSSRAIRCAAEVIGSLNSQGTQFFFFPHFFAIALVWGPVPWGTEADVVRGLCLHAHVNDDARHVEFFETEDLEIRLSHVG